MESICPILSLKEGLPVQHCEGVRCAWWDKTLSQCALASIAGWLAAIKASLQIMTEED